MNRYYLSIFDRLGYEVLNPNQAELHLLYKVKKYMMMEFLMYIFLLVKINMHIYRLVNIQWIMKDMK